MSNTQPVGERDLERWHLGPQSSRPLASTRVTA